MVVSYLYFLTTSMTSCSRTTLNDVFRSVFASHTLIPSCTIASAGEEGKRQPQHLSVYDGNHKMEGSFKQFKGADPHLFLEGADEVEVVVCDVVVVVFDLREGFLVRLHEPLDVGVLSLFDPGRFSFSRRVQLFPHLCGCVRRECTKQTGGKTRGEGGDRGVRDSHHSMQHRLL